ncbi:MAG: sulfotransferase [Hyphomonadaceae bacterium]|jgi:hypothetical protein|nr:sulfotransferase [Hyphomonadaceae bacterium]
MHEERAPRSAAPFVVGAPRSGTTLLRMMLDAHPLLAIPPETGYAGMLAAHGEEMARDDFLSLLTRSPNWVDFHLPTADFKMALDDTQPFTRAQGLRCFYSLYARRFGKPRWGDKTPDHGLSIGPISALLPEAHFIHIIRDGRDAAVSLRELWFAPSRDYEELGAVWSERVQQARAQGAQIAHYMEVRYEALVTRTEATLRAVCAFLDLAFDARMLAYHAAAAARLEEHEGRVNADGSVLITKAQRMAQQRRVLEPPSPSRIGAWRTAMSAAEHARFLSTAGPLLERLGYL